MTMKDLSSEFADIYFVGNSMTFCFLVLVLLSSCKMAAFTTTFLDHNWFHCNDSLVLYQCKKCDFSSNERIGKLCHVCDVELLSEVTFWKCDECSFGSYSALVLAGHKLKHVKRNTLENFKQWCDSKRGRLSELGRYNNIHKTSNKKHTCDQCTYSTNSEFILKRHINGKHVPDDQAVWFKCRLCSWKGKYKPAFVAHVKAKHCKDQEYKCKECSYQTPSKSYLKVHITLKHTPPDLIKWYYCDQCNYKAKHHSSLNSHTKYKHSGGKIKKTISTQRKIKIKDYERMKRAKAANNYQCDQCSFKTYREINLKWHMNGKHSSDDKAKWYECSLCSWKGKYIQSLNYHTRSKHPQGEMQFQCPKCEYITFRKGYLNQHISLNHTSENLM